jgi:glycosyltransferase involved in cell wall biosynthesis
MSAPNGQFDFDFCSGIYGFQAVSMSIFADEMRKEFQLRGCRYNEISMRLQGLLGRGPLGFLAGILCRYLLYPLKVRLQRKTDVVFIADSANAGIFNLLPRRVKTVIFLHGLAYQEDKNVLGIEVDLKDRLIQLASRIFKRRGLLQCDLLFTSSVRGKQDFQRFAGKHLKQEVFIAPLGLDAQFVKTDCGDLHLQLGIAPETRVILSVAAADLRKNITTLIRALERLDSRLTDWIWIHIGGLHPSVRAQISQTVQNKSLLLEYVEFSGMPRYYSLADVFVLPTQYDTFCWPPHEAAACGCPVIVSNIAPLNENLRDVAIFVDPSSAEQVEEAIYRVLTEPELASVLSAKGLVVRERFTWSKTSEIVLAGICKLRNKQAK